MNWCFAKINNRIGEIYFDRTKGGQARIFSHCFIERANFIAKEENEAFESDAKKFKVVYKNKKYTLIK